MHALLKEHRAPLRYTEADLEDDLAIVIAYAALFGTARQADEGAAAHLWQLLMAGVDLTFYLRLSGMDGLL